MKRLFRLFQNGNALAISLPLFALVVWVFLPSLRGDFIEFDDSVYVTGNAHVTGGLTLENLAWAFCHTVVGVWHPLAFWSHMLDCQLYGLKPWGHHLTSVLVHGVNVVLVFLVLRQITGATWRSLLVAGLFGLHPLRVESVTWICERKDVLSLMFWLLTISAYAKYIAVSKAHGPKSTGWYGLALVLFCCGLMSKPMVVTLPFVLVLLDYWPLQCFQCPIPDSPRTFFLKSVWGKAPFFMLTVVICTFAFIFGKANGVMDFLPGLTMGARLGNALISYCRYLGKLFWPANLCAHYLHPGHWPLGKVLLTGLFLSGISVFVFAWRRQRPYLLVGWLWYLGVLVPVIGLVPVGTHSLADRYLYIPCLGILVALVWGACELNRRWRHQTFDLSVTGGVLALVCIGLTRHQIGFWHDGVSVWSRAITVEKNNYDAHDRLGRAFFSYQRIDEAIREFQEAVRLKPDVAATYCSLGRILYSQGRIDEAIENYQKALKVQPDSVVAHNNLGNLLFQKGQVNEAVRELQEAVRLNPGFAEAYCSLGQVFVAKGRVEEAIACYQKALEIRPDFVEAHDKLANLLFQNGRVEEAIRYFKKAAEIQPDNAEFHNNLGWALRRRGRVEDALGQFQWAVRSNPAWAVARHSLGDALCEQGRLDEGIHEFQEALRLQPDWAVASNDLAVAVRLRDKLTGPPTGATGP
jgi:tetratricopeptide (TPR) repeat protein